jgi:hypothetical protein
MARKPPIVASAVQAFLSAPEYCAQASWSYRSAAASSREPRATSTLGPPSKLHSLTVSNFGTVSETEMGKRVAKIAIGR